MCCRPPFPALGVLHLPRVSRVILLAGPGRSCGLLGIGPITDIWTIIVNPMKFVDGPAGLLTRILHEPSRGTERLHD